MPNIDSQTVQLAIVAIMALALLIQTIVLLIILGVVRKAAQSIREDIDDLRSSIIPILDNARDLTQNARDLFQRMAPKFESAVADVANVAHGLRIQASDVQSSAMEILERVRRQVVRLDAMTGTVLDAINRFSSFMTDAVSKPVRQVSGMLAAARTVLESLRSPSREQQSSPAQPPADKDMFV